MDEPLVSNLMDTLDIAIEDVRWESVGIQSLSETAVVATLDHLLLAPEICEVGVLACDDARIAVLNADFRDKSSATNVLSWPAAERAADQPGGAPVTPTAGPDGMIELGDIAVSYDTCHAEALAAERPMQAHVTHLIIHGVLHLLGYDHTTDADAALMERIEVEILGKLGWDNPYRIA